MTNRGETANKLDCIIVGVGNTLMLDEGVGVLVARDMESSGEYPPGFEVVEAGASSFNIIHLISSKNIAAVVDCAYMGEEPGTIRMFTPEEAKSRKIITGLSLHEGDLMQSVRVMEHMGEMPRRLYFFGIEPLKVEPGDGLTPLIEQKLKDYSVFINESLSMVVKKFENKDA